MEIATEIAKRYRRSRSYCSFVMSITLFKTIRNVALMTAIFPVFTNVTPKCFAAIGAGLVGAAAMNAAGRNPEKINDLRTMMILGISFIDALSIIGFIVDIVGRVM